MPPTTADGYTVVTWAVTSASSGVWDAGAVFLLRVALPDRPGSLGLVASALGTVQADISAVEIVERGNGYAIDDFMLSLPPEGKPDWLISACAGLDDVEVMWVSYYPESWGLEADSDLLDRMASDPGEARRTLVLGAPAVFHCAWALVVDRETGRVVTRSDLAPDSLDDPGHLGRLDDAHPMELPAGWQTGWGETMAACAPLHERYALVIGRSGGPEFRASEVVRLRHLASLCPVAASARTP